MTTKSQGHIAFDASWIGTSGIGRFAAETLTRRPNWIPISYGGRPTSPAAPLRLGMASRDLAGARILVSPGYMPPIGARIPYAVTLHDLMYLSGGANHSRLRSGYFRAIRRQFSSNQCAVLTVSEYSKSQILEWTDGKAAVHVVGNGVSPPDDVRRLDSHQQTGRTLALIVASERPNKNLVRQLRAADLALGDSGGQLDLVLPSPPSTHLVGEVKRLNCDVRVSVQISESELWDRYRSASALICASLEEGFGLPALEAMAASCPVVYSDVGGLSEVVGGCGFVVDPTDERSIADGIHAALEHNEANTEIVRLAHQRSLCFTWDRVVEKIDDAIEDLLS
jgi:glycosyltransferase involved in cell wall biosynthesis